MLGKFAVCVIGFFKMCVHNQCVWHTPRTCMRCFPDTSELHYIFNVILFFMIGARVLGTLQSFGNTLRTINTKMFAIQKKILRGISFVEITKIFSSVDPESGHSCLVFVQYPRDSPRSAWELQKKSVPQRIPVKFYKKKYKEKPGGELSCKNFGVNDISGNWMTSFGWAMKSHVRKQNAFSRAQFWTSNLLCFPA